MFLNEHWLYYIQFLNELCFCRFCTFPILKPFGLAHLRQLRSPDLRLRAFALSGDLFQSLDPLERLKWALYVQTRSESDIRFILMSDH